MKVRSRAKPAKPAAHASAEPVRAGWATDLVFDVREPKLAVSLRLDADVLRFFRGFGGGYQTRINEVLKAFMQARGGAEPVSHAAVNAKASRGSASNGKRASR
ncbi:MAG TPA: BrnA antitoxin family protein [Rhodopila sp.]|nr:BrnA antitoxin family protein [Rhodopila sp.]